MYDTILEEDVEHITKLIEWLRDEARRSPGDGDGAWYSDYYATQDLLPLVVKVNRNDYWTVSFDGTTIRWGHEQEGILITNDEVLFDSLPDWIQVKMRY